MAASSPRRGLEKNTKLFSGFHFVFLGSKHASRLKTLLEERGAVVEDDFSLSTGHYGVLGEGAGSGKEVFRKLEEKGLLGIKGVTFVRSQWLTSSIKAGKLVNKEAYVVEAPQRGDAEDAVSRVPETIPSSQVSALTNFTQTLGSLPESNTPASLPDLDGQVAVQETLRALKDHWMNFYRKPRSESQVTESPDLVRGEPAVPTNRIVVEKLKELVDAYRSDFRNDSAGGFRARASRHAISVLSSPPFGLCDGDRQIKDAKEILSTKHGGLLPRGVGPKTAEKVEEILASPSHTLGRLEDMASDPVMRVIDVFTKVWGCGVEIAKSWYSLGHRTIADVQEAARQNPGGMRVSPMIRLGIKYYDDLQRPVSRDQMEGAHAAFVEATREIAEEEGLEVILAGSYRRGKASTHDVDLLVLSSSVDLQATMGKIAKAMRASGLLLDFCEGRSRGKSKGKLEEDDEEDEVAGRVKSCMLMSIIKFPGGQVGRADVKLYHKTSRAFALLHCTGSADFNRAMRWWPLRETRGETIRTATPPSSNVLTLPFVCGAREELAESLKSLPTQSAVRYFLTRKKDREDQQRLLHKSWSDDPPNSFKLTDTELRPVLRQRRGKRLTRNIIWEAAEEDCVKCETEEEVFRVLGLAYVPPHLRKM